MEVSDAEGFADALHVGAQHIVLSQHLNLSDAAPDNTSSLQWPYVFHVPSTVRSLQVRRILKRGTALCLSPAWPPRRRACVRCGTPGAGNALTHLWRACCEPSRAVGM